jgi:CRISPR-associated protein Cas1
MHQLLNTLYVTTEGAYLRLDHETLKVDVEGVTKLQVPLHHLGGIVCFGNVLVSPFLLHRCAEDGRSVVFLNYHGRFKARVEGPVSGNVLLRRAQHQALADPTKPPLIARHIVAGKIQNARQVILRSAREAEDSSDSAFLDQCADELRDSLARLEKSAGLDDVRGIEGNAARAYFDVFDRMVRANRDDFHMNGRSRRPPLDRMNALLSFLYTLLLGDCVASVEGVGLDPQVGFLHALRPGRPALALDMMEELRAVLADRLALTLINRQQLTAKDFEERTGGAVYLNESGRKTVLVAYQKRKQDEIQHAVLERQVPFGLVPHVQARLLARFLRGDLPDYPPFLYR